jgi:hypothetical protein
VPASPWLGGAVPIKPGVSIIGVPNAVRVNWNAGGTNSPPVRWWMVQTKFFSDWKTEVFPREVTSEFLTGTPEVVAVTAIDRVGNASPARVMELVKEPAQKRILLKK